MSDLAFADLALAEPAACSTSRPSSLCASGGGLAVAQAGLPAWGDRGAARVDPDRSIAPHVTSSTRGARSTGRLPIEGYHAAPSAPEGTARMTVAIDEAVLTERFRHGDRSAFAELVRRHQRTAFAVVWRYVRNDEDAKDIAQAAFVRAWQNADTFRGDASFRTWVLRIAGNLALNHVRDRGRWRADELDENTVDSLPTASESLGQAQTSELLRQAVETLPPKQRLVVELRVQEGLSFREVADATATSEDSAKANFHHALKRLRSLLRETSH